MLSTWGCSSAGEHRVRNEGVEGSNPFISTRNYLGNQDVGFEPGILIFLCPLDLYTFCTRLSPVALFHLLATRISVCPWSKVIESMALISSASPMRP